MTAPIHLLTGISDSPDAEPADEEIEPAVEVPEEPISPPTSPMSAMDRKLAAEAYKKVIDGRELTSREQTALKRIEKEKEERLRWQYYAAIPQKHWRAMCGRQTKVINEQALRYDLPFGGATVNLPAVVRALHDFLAENAHKLNKDDDELLLGNGSPALERYREERALLARLDRQEREGQLLPREVTRIALGRVANILREAGDTLNRQYGAAAGEILSEAIEDAMREIDSTFGNLPANLQEPEGSHGDPEPPELPDGPDEPSGAG